MTDSASMRNDDNKTVELGCMLILFVLSVSVIIEVAARAGLIAQTKLNLYIVIGVGVFISIVAAWIIVWSMYQNIL